MALGQAFGAVNWIAVLLGGVFNTIIGALWYGPLFGNLWLRLIGKSRDELESTPAMYIVPFVAALVSALVLAVLIEGFGITAWWEGLMLGAVVWLGVGAAASLTTSFFEGTGAGLWLLFALYQLVVYAAQGVVFAVW